jgi:hypothetical protein
LLSQKNAVETLRTRGFEWADGKPVTSVRLKWLPFVGDPSWLKIERWIKQANLLNDEEMAHDQAPDELLDRLPRVNFEIRNYRGVEPAYLYDLIRNIRRTLEAVALSPKPGGIEHVEPDPLMLFLLALGTAESRKIRRCPVCDKFFYAQRTDQLACSRPCANVERQRKFRRSRPQYEKNRRRNKEMKKKRRALRLRRKLT